jgi:AcrR family transcriptional regulator
MFCPEFVQKCLCRLYAFLVIDKERFLAGRKIYDEAVRGVSMNEPSSRARDTRKQIIEAADRALRTKGLLGASTREIAREAGVADGTLYVHFADRIELFLALLTEYLPPFVEPLRRLQHLVGRRTVRLNLRDVLEGALAWHANILPLFSALAADPPLLKAFRTRLAERNEGPHLSIEAIERYLVAEQRAGRVHPRANPRAAAMLLLGASQYWTSIVQNVGTDLGFSREQFLKHSIQVLMIGLDSPARSTNGKPGKSTPTG